MSLTCPQWDPFIPERFLLAAGSHYGSAGASFIEKQGKKSNYLGARLEGREAEQEAAGTYSVLFVLLNMFISVCYQPSLTCFM